MDDYLGNGIMKVWGFHSPTEKGVVSFSYLWHRILPQFLESQLIPSSAAQPVCFNRAIKLKFCSALALTDGLVQVMLCGKFIPSQSFFCWQREDNHFFLAWFSTQSSLSLRAQLSPYNHSKSHLGQSKCCPCCLTTVLLLHPFLIFSAPLWKIDVLCSPVGSILEFWLWNILFPHGVCVSVCLKFIYTE